MKSITFIAIAISLSLVQFVGAQENDSNKNQQNIEIAITKLNEAKNQIEKEEKALLRAEVEAIMERLDKEEITFIQATKLKQEAAESRALNIQNRHAIIDNKIALVERNGIEKDTTAYGTRIVLGLGQEDINNDRIFGIKYQSSEEKERKYDKRTIGNLVYAAGYANGFVNDMSLADSPYEFSEAGYQELGYSWSTRVFKNTNALRFKYGLSFQWNKFALDDNEFFVKEDGELTVQQFDFDLKKQHLRLTNLIVPVFFELGTSKKIEKEEYIRFQTYNQPKIGFGGYAGFNIGSQQKLKFRDENGDKVKLKERRDFNTTDFVYGLSGYIGWGLFAIEVKYGLNDTFTNDSFQQNDITFGLRIEL